MFEGIIPDLSFITNQMLIEYSILVIEASIVIIVLGLIVIFLARRRSAEEKHAIKVLSAVEKMKAGKFAHKSAEKKPAIEKVQNAKAHKESAAEKKLEISKGENSLKTMLVKKFKPKIESQLNTKVNILDFNAQNQNFLALVEISGVKLLLTLDSSGKILDYKKVKQNQ
jgi:hypothetical protein